MGGVNKKTQQLIGILKYDNKQWVKIQASQANNRYVYEGSDIRFRGLEGEINVVKIDETMSEIQELQIYAYRKQKIHSLVRSFGVSTIGIEQNTRMLCGNQKAMKVLTESLVRLLPDLPVLTLDQILYVLKQSIQGYQILYKKLGTFQVSANMMGINSRGQFKVWCNQILYHNHPQNQKFVSQQRIDPSSKEENKMVHVLLNIIEKKCGAYGQYPYELGNRIYSVNKNGDDFQTVIREIEQFISLNGRQIPSRLDRVLGKMIKQNYQSTQVGSRVSHTESTKTGFFKSLESGSGSIKNDPSAFSFGSPSIVSHQSPKNKVLNGIGNINSFKKISIGQTNANVNFGNGEGNRGISPYYTSPPKNHVMITHPKSMIYQNPQVKDKINGYSSHVIPQRNTLGFVSQEDLNRNRRSDDVRSVSNDKNCFKNIRNLGKVKSVDKLHGKIYLNNQMIPTPIPILNTKQSLGTVDSQYFGEHKKQDKIRNKMKK